MHDSLYDSLVTAYLGTHAAQLRVTRVEVAGTLTLRPRLRGHGRHVTRAVREAEGAVLVTQPAEPVAFTEASSILNSV